jgi:hypothetical protein
MEQNDEGCDFGGGADIRELTLAQIERVVGAEALSNVVA